MRPRFYELLFLTLLGVTVLSSILWPQRSLVADVLLPLYRAELRLLLPDGHRLESLQLESRSGEPMLVMRVTLTRPTLVAGNLVLQSGQQLTSQTLLAHAFSGIVLFLATVLSGSVLLRANPRWILGMTAPAILLLVVIDIPGVLYGALLGLENAGQIEDFPRLPWQTLWTDFLTGGGRYFLSLICGALVITIAIFRHHPLTALRSGGSGKP